MEFHEMSIDDPREIFTAVRRTAESAESEGPYRVGLNHNHTSAIRGYGEVETGLDMDFDLEYPVELTREDGGNTWYHSSESRCLMIGIPDQTARNHVEYMKAWGNSLASELESFAEENSMDISPEYRGPQEGKGLAGDVYDADTGRQLIGLSGKSFRDATVVRACMYDGKNHGEVFEEIVEADTGSTERFNEKYVPVEGFYRHVVGEEDEVNEVRIERQLEPHTSSDRGRWPSPCIDKLK